MSKIPFAAPLIGDEERNAVLEVLAGPILVHGPQAELFEAEFAAWTGAPHAVTVSSCTAGMHLVYFALGFGPGDEVICPAQTHTATAHAIELTGARAVFVDAEGETGNIDIGAIEAAITPRTRAIAVVHYLGLPVDMVKVNEIARRHGLFVLEDCALAMGTRLDGVHAGLMGDVGVFSFYPVKHMTTAEGGMIITRDAELAKKLKLLKAFGVDRTHAQRNVPGTYDVVALGLNYRMNELQAALGRVQIKRMDDFLAVRRRNADVLRAALEGFGAVRLLPDGTGRFVHSNYCLSAVLAEDLAPRRREIVAAMSEQGVGTSVYYPAPVPRMTYYSEKYGYDPARFANAARISDTSIALPVGPHLSEQQVSRVAEVLKSACSAKG